MRGVKGGDKILNSDGYVMVRAPNHPACGRSERLAEHRLVMEAHLGRYLSGTEEIHHKDHDRTNNAIGNLKLCKDHAEHMRLHKKPKRFCKLCSEVHYGLGFCHKHYHVHRRKLDRFSAYCEECQSPMRHPRYVSKDKRVLCKKCRWPKLKCSVCGQPAKVKGLCKRHYSDHHQKIPCSKCGQIIRLGGRNHFPPVCWSCKFPKRVCRICGGKHEASGLCENHYKKLKRGTLRE